MPALLWSHLHLHDSTVRTSLMASVYRPCTGQILACRHNGYLYNFCHAYMPNLFAGRLKKLSAGSRKTIADLRDAMQNLCGPCPFPSYCVAVEDLWLKIGSETESVKKSQCFEKGRLFKTRVSLDFEAHLQTKSCFPTTWRHGINDT